MSMSQKQGVFGIKKVHSCARSCDMCPVMSDDVRCSYLVFNDFSGSISLLCEPCMELSRRMFEFVFQADHDHISTSVITKFLRDDLNRNGKWAEFFGETCSLFLEKVDHKINQTLLGAQIGTRLYVAYKAGVMKHPCVRPTKTHMQHFYGSLSIGTNIADISEKILHQVSISTENASKRGLHFMLNGICLQGVGFPHKNATMFEVCPMPPDLSVSAAQLLLFRNIYRDKKACMNCKVHKSVNQTLQLCSGCYGVAFCSATCQKEYWPMHKIICNEIRTHDAKYELLKSRKNGE